METQTYISIGTALAVLGLLIPIWQEKKDQEKRLASLEANIKHLETSIDNAKADAEKLETKLEKKIENIEDKLTSIAVAISRIETKLSTM